MSGSLNLKSSAHQVEVGCASRNTALKETRYVPGSQCGVFYARVLTREDKPRGTPTRHLYRES